MNKTLLLTTTAISMLAFGANAADVTLNVIGSSLNSQPVGAVIGKVTNVQETDLASTLASKINAAQTAAQVTSAINSALANGGDAYVKTSGLADYAKKTDLNDYAKTADLGAYVKDADLATKVEAAGFIKSVDTSNLADKDLSNLSDAGKTVITDLVAAEGYAKTTDLDAKQDVIDANNKLAADLVDFSPEQQAAIDSGITSTLVGQITKNQADIATNADDIAQNTAAILGIGSDVAKIGADVTKNKADIAQNKADIEKNAADIADLDANKQDKLNIETDSGLKLGTDGKTLSVVAGTGMEVTSAGVGIANLGVDTDQLASKAVTKDKIGDLAVGEGQLNTDAVTNSKIKDGAVTLSKIDGSAFDTAVTASSDNLVSSGTVFTHVKNNAENATYDGTKVNIASGTNTIKGAIQDVDAALGKVTDVTVNGYDTTQSANQNLTGAVSALNSNMQTVLGGIYGSDGSYDNTALAGNGFKAEGDNLAAQLNNYAGNVQQALGTTFTNGAFSNDYTTTTVGDDIAATDNLVTAISKVNTNLENILTTDGTEVDSAKVDVQWNGADNTLAGVLGDGAYTNEYNVTAGDSLTAAIDALDGAIGDRNISSANDSIKTATASSLAEGLAAAGNAIGSQKYANGKPVSYEVIADDTDLTTAVSQVASNIGEAVSGMATRESTFSLNAGNTVNQNLLALDQAIGASVSGMNTRATADFELKADNTINENLVALDKAIGADVTVTFNDLKAENSVNENIDALNSIIGDIKTMAPTYNNLSDTAGTAPATVADALNTLDTRLGTIHGLVADQTATTTTTDDAYYGNLAEGTTVQNHLSALDAAIGDRRNMASSNAEVNEASKESLAKGLEAAANAIGDAKFDGTQYASTVDNISSAVRSLDSNLYRLENEVRDLRKGFNRGMASMAAMSALVPNARASGNTQLSLGTGMYSGHAGFALGGFHWITNNLLVNAGVAYGKGDSSDVVYRAGVTYSW